MRIRKDQFEAWKASDITKLYISDIMAILSDVTLSRVAGLTTDEIIRSAHERNAKMQVLETVLNWTPSELLSNDEDKHAGKPTSY